MLLTLEPARFLLESPNMRLRVEIRPRRSVEADETQVQILISNGPPVTFLPERAGRVSPARWCWDGSTAQGKLIARRTLRQLRTLVSRAHARDARLNASRVWCSDVLSCLGR